MTTTGDAIRARIAARRAEQAARLAPPAPVEEDKPKRGKREEPEPIAEPQWEEPAEELTEDE